MKVVIIGGDTAGMSTASQVKRQNPSGRLSFLGRAHISHMRPVKFHIMLDVR